MIVPANFLGIVTLRYPHYAKLQTSLSLRKLSDRVFKKVENGNDLQTADRPKRPLVWTQQAVINSRFEPHSRDFKC